MFARHDTPARTSSYMGRLRRDKSGNTLALMAAFMIPLCALAGSAIDMARLYVVKVRLQQACDAGVLAGRKFMASSNDVALDSTAVTRAKTFFANNFESGFMGTGAFTAATNPYPFTPTKTTDQQVAGTASVAVPMTIMKMFGYDTQTVAVSCEARFDVADTDIMFVLDTTGSMACLPQLTEAQCSASLDDAVTYTRPSTNTGGVAGYAGSTGYRVPEKMSGTTNQSRIDALRTAVKDFYDTMAANVDPSTHIRYGFVTYSSMVNAGKAIMDISPNYIIGGTGTGQWTYQSRSVNADYVMSNGAWADTNPNKTQTDCLATATVRTPATAKTYASNGTATQTEYRFNTAVTPNKCQVRTNTLGPQWKYQPVTYNVGPYVGGNLITDPSKVNSATTRWMGCIEERGTTAGQLTFNVNNLPSDLDPDLGPTSDATKWRPYWPDVEYVRPTYNSYPTSNGDSSSYESYMDPDRLILGKNGCAKPVQRLKVMTATDINAFVTASDFVPIGGTYHDIGMIWGVRLLSPNGIFKNDTAAWPGRQQPKRIIVFMTDGAMSPSLDAYSVYGVEQLDRRVTDGDLDDRKDYHNARFLAECNKAKAMNIDVWTVAIAPAADVNLTACASVSAQAFFTTSGTGLSDKFKQIAKQVAMLRISQ
jgi:Flp pilus assembly protein TadG